MKYEKISVEQHRDWGVRLRAAQALMREIQSKFPKSHPQAAAARGAEHALVHAKMRLELRLFQDHPDQDRDEAVRVYYGSHPEEDTP